MRVLSSLEPLTDRGQAPKGVQYCKVTGRIPAYFRQDVFDCALEVDTAVRSPLLEHDAKTIQISNGPHWSRGGVSSNIYGMRLACAEPPGHTISAWADVPFAAQIADKAFARECFEGSEVGELGAGGELRWAVNAGQLRISILSYQSAGERPWLITATFNVLPGQTYKFTWKTGAALSNRRLLLDGDIVMEPQP